MRKPFHGKRRKVTESGGIFLRDDYQFTCRSQPLESRLYFLDVMPIEGVMIRKDQRGDMLRIFMDLFSRGAGDAIPDTNKTSVVEASPFNVRLGALPEKTGSSSP